MSEEEAQDILERYRYGNATAEEVSLVESWYLQQLAAHPGHALPGDPGSLEADMWAFIQLHRSRKKVRRLSIGWLSAAALFIVALATALYFYRSGTIVNRKSPIVNEINPGGNRATLTLADGRSISLDSTQSGIVVGDKDIIYNNGKSLQGVILSGESVVGKSGVRSASGGLPTSLTLSTPRGGQYQIILPDGTKVWLNAASTLKYPSKFTGDTRVVELEGEAYFSVNNSELSPFGGGRVGQSGGRGRNVPFVVKTKNQSVTVLGTEFNVAAYADDKETKTTLVKGKIQIRSPNLTLKTYNVQLLNPQQQSVVKGDDLTVSEVDMGSILAWKNGNFSFEGEDIKAIMKKLARWYDVDVVYQGPVPAIHFGGSASRFDKVSTVLQILSLTGKVHFKIEGRTIKVSQ